MAFEKEIKAAQKVCDTWMARSQRDYNFFMDMKKNSVAWEKDAIKVIEEHIKAARMDQALSGIEGGRKYLTEYTEQCNDVYREHFQFTRGLPRKGNVGICEAIKLDAKDAAFKPVCAAMEKELIKQTKQFKETEDLWLSDVKAKIDILLSKLDTLEKLATGQEREMTAFGKQFARDKEAFFEQMSGALTALKPTSAELIIERLSADPATWVNGDPKMRLDQYNIMKARIDSMPKIMALAVKNYNRIVKSVPQEVRAKLMFSRGLKDFESRFEKLKVDLNIAEGTFKNAAALIEKNFPEIG